MLFAVVVVVVVDIYYVLYYYVLYTFSFQTILSTLRVFRLIFSFITVLSHICCMNLYYIFLNGFSVGIWFCRQSTIPLATYVKYGFSLYATLTKTTKHTHIYICLNTNCVYVESWILNMNLLYSIRCSQHFGWLTWLSLRIFFLNLLKRDFFPLSMESRLECYIFW